MLRQVVPIGSWLPDPNGTPAELGREGLQKSPCGCSQACMAHVKTPCRLPWRLLLRSLADMQISLSRNKLN